MELTPTQALDKFEKENPIFRITRAPLNNRLYAERFTQWLRDNDITLLSNDK